MMKKIFLGLLAVTAIIIAASCSSEDDKAKFHVLQADGSWKETEIEISDGALKTGIPEVPEVKLEKNVTASGIDFTANQTAIRADEFWYASEACAENDAKFVPNNPEKGDWYPKYRLSAPAATILLDDDLTIECEIHDDVGNDINEEITISLTDAKFAEMNAGKDVTDWFSVSKTGSEPATLTIYGLGAKIKTKVNKGDSSVTITIAGTSVFPGVSAPNPGDISTKIKADALVSGGTLDASVQNDHTFQIYVTAMSGGGGD